MSLRSLFGCVLLTAPSRAWSLALYGLQDLSRPKACCTLKANELSGARLIVMNEGLCPGTGLDRGLP